MRIRGWLVGAAAFVALLAQPSAQSATSWRPTVVARHGMVAAGHPLAAEAGLRILKAGGNAVDAAIATWAVQGEVEPAMTGLGADMFMLIYLAKTGEVKFINGTGFAPQAATIDFYNSKGGLPDQGPLSIAVPGAVGGAAFALRKYGTDPWPMSSLRRSRSPSRASRSPRRWRDSWPAAGPSSRNGHRRRTMWFKDGKPLRRAISSSTPRSRGRCARSPRRGRRLLPRRRREEHGGVPEKVRQHHHRGGSPELRAVRGRAGPDQLPRHGRLRVPAEFAGLPDARGAQHPRGVRPAAPWGTTARRTCTRSPRR